MDDFLLRLSSLPNARATSTGSEVAVRCPFCGDSVKSSRPHLYIGTKNKYDILFYHCKLCPASGVVTAETLRRIGINDIESLEFIKRLNLLQKQNYSMKINGKNNYLAVNNYTIPTIINPEDSFKIEYLYQRTHIDFTDEKNIKDYKIILNLKNFLLINNIPIYENMAYIDDISQHFVGFLSYNKGIINFRNINSDYIKERYLNYTIDKSKRVPFFYIPPCNVNPMTLYPNIVLAEGAFDIICIKNQFYPSDSNDYIFGAVGDRTSFKHILLKLISLSGFTDGTVHVYADVDNRRKGYEPIIMKFREEIFRPYLKNFKFKVYVNDDETKKDFGYISDTEWKIKTFLIN